jgi:hypothetical protein
MKKHYLLIWLLLLLECKNSNVELIQCNAEKKIFTLENSHLLSLDLIDSYSDFKKYSYEIQDTIRGCYNYFGLLYNYQDSNLIPNKDTSFNILVPCFQMVSPECHICKSYQSDLKILLLPYDSLIVIYSDGSTKFDFLKDRIKINKMIFDHFYRNFLDSSKVINQNELWTHVYIDSTLNFKSSIEAIFKIVLNEYCNSFNLFIKNRYGMRFCDLTSDIQNMLINKYHYKLIIDDFDLRKNIDDRLVIPDTVKEEIKLIIF